MLWFRIEQVQIFKERHREGMVFGDEPILFGVPAKVGESLIFPSPPVTVQPRLSPRGCRPHQK
jgi:hypothetical protein